MMDMDLSKNYEDPDTGTAEGFRESQRLERVADYALAALEALGALNSPEAAAWWAERKVSLAKRQAWLESPNPWGLLPDNAIVSGLPHKGD